jgi:uncharacterized membrane protein
MKFGATRTGTEIRFTEDFFYLTLLGVVAAIAGGLAADLVIVLNRNFLTIACDTAVLENAIVNTMHGHWFQLNGVGGLNLLGAHTTFLLLALVPFYVVAPYPETLFVLQCIGIFSTVFPLYLVGRDFGLKPPVAYFVAATSLISGYVLNMAMAPFHLETWVAAAALWAYHFYLRNNRLGFIISLLVAVCCGEQASLILIALGISLLLVRDECAWRRQYGLIALLGGVAWLGLAIGVISPMAGHPTTFNIYAYNYTQWGIKSASGLPGAILADPRKALEFLFAPARWEHFVAMVGLLVVTAFCSRRSILLLLPMPAYLLMDDQEYFLYFHAYYFSFLFFAGYIGLFHLLRRFNPTGQPAMVGFSLFGLMAVLSLCFWAGYYNQLAGGIDEPFSTMLRQQFARIPPDATVYGPHRFSIYLSNRVNFVMGDMPPEGTSFDDMVEAEFDRFNVHPAQIDFIVTDFWTDQCGWRRGFLSEQDTQKRQDAINKLIASRQWAIAWQANDVVILQRVKSR